MSERVALNGRVVEDELPAQMIVATLHRGPYEDLPKAYLALQEYMDSHGMVAAGPMREQYLNGPPNTSPEDYETRIQWPIGRAA